MQNASENLSKLSEASFYILYLLNYFVNYPIYISILFIPLSCNLFQ